MMPADPGDTGEEHLTQPFVNPWETHTGVPANSKQLYSGYSVGGRALDKQKHMR